MPLVISPEVVNKATFLMAITQYNSNNSLLNELFLKKEIIWMNYIINIPTKAEERSMIQISFRTQDPNIRPAQSGIRVKITADP